MIEAQRRKGVTLSQLNDAAAQRGAQIVEASRERTVRRPVPSVRSSTRNGERVKTL